MTARHDSGGGSGGGHHGGPGDGEDRGGPTDESGGGSQSSAGASGSDDSDGSSGGATAGGGASSGRRVYPEAGNYMYEQTGWEEFCQATCDREDLPSQQLLDVSLKGANSDRAVVEAEAHQSDSRTTRTTMLFTRSGALITNVYAKVSYSGFTIEENYEPDPPVESLRFPLELGESWSGRWEADTSGDYSVQVVERDAVDVDGRTVEAIVVRTATDFRGEYDGRADITVWLDPDTRSVVKSTGEVHLRSEFGAYGSRFQISLTRGPGY